MSVYDNPNDYIGQSHFELISRIYDLPLRPEGWAAVLDEFSSLMNAGMVCMAAFDSRHSEHQMGAITSGTSPLIIAEYQSRFASGQESPFAKLAHEPRRAFMADLEMLDLDAVEAYAARPGVQWFREKYQLYRGAASGLNLNRAWTDIIFMLYPPSRGSITLQEKKAGDYFLDHFAKSVELCRAFGVLKSRFDATLTALDRFHIGIFIVSSNGSVVLKNREAERILDASDGLAITRAGELYPSAEAEREELKVALGRAARTAQAGHDRAESLLTLPRNSGEDPYLVEVSPLRDRDQIESQFTGALVFVIDPAKTDVVTTEGMQALYGLTKSESEVCRLLAEGYETDDIADTRTLTRETVRNYIKQILQKTGTNNRSQIVRLALNVNLPIDPALDKK